VKLVPVSRSSMLDKTIGPVVREIGECKEGGADLGQAADVTGMN
jgi:hypothetical protein